MILKGLTSIEQRSQTDSMKADNAQIECDLDSFSTNGEDSIFNIQDSRFFILHNLL